MGRNGKNAGHKLRKYVKKSFYFAQHSRSSAFNFVPCPGLVSRVPGPGTCLLRSVLDEVSALLASVPWQPALMRPERRAARATFHYVDFFQSFSLIFSFDSCCVSLGTFVQGLFPLPGLVGSSGDSKCPFGLLRKCRSLMPQSGAGPGATTG